MSLIANWTNRLLHPARSIEIEPIVRRPSVTQTQKPTVVDVPVPTGVTASPKPSINLDAVRNRLETDPALRNTVLETALKSLGAQPGVAQAQLAGLEDSGAGRAHAVVELTSPFAQGVVARTHVAIDDLAHASELQVMIGGHGMVRTAGQLAAQEKAMAFLRPPLALKDGPSVMRALEQMPALKEALFQAAFPHGGFAPEMVTPRISEVEPNPAHRGHHVGVELVSNLTHQVVERGRALLKVEGKAEPLFRMVHHHDLRTPEARQRNTAENAWEHPATTPPTLAQVKEWTARNPTLITALVQAAFHQNNAVADDARIVSVAPDESHRGVMVTVERGQAAQRQTGVALLRYNGNVDPLFQATR